MSLNTKVQRKKISIPLNPIPFYSVWMLGMFFPGLTTYQKPVYPQNPMLLQVSDKSPLLQDQCYHLPFGQRFSSELSFIWTSPSAAWILQSSLASFAMQLICWFTAEINTNMGTGERWFQENFKPLASHWMTNVNSEKAADECCRAQAWQAGILARHRQTENTEYFTCNTTYFISKKVPVYVKLFE